MYVWATLAGATGINLGGGKPRQFAYRCVQLLVELLLEFKLKINKPSQDF